MIYLDYAATTPVDPRVLEVMLPYLGSRAFGNAASAHGRGRAAARAVARGRLHVADLIGVSPNQVVFTSGATEALNTALKGLADSRAAGRDVLIVSDIEHKAVLDTTAYLEDRQGVEVIRIAPSQDGEVTTASVVDALGAYGDRAFALAVMAVNNETGVVNDVAAIAEAAAGAGVPYVCDATQAVGWGLVDLESAPGAVFAAISAHKIYGPQGVGALVLPPKRNRPAIQPLVHGGGHEGGMRSGTLNVAAIVGFGRAAELVSEAGGSDGERCRALADRFAAALTTQLRAKRTVGLATTAPHVLSMRIPGVDAEALVANCRDVALSAGSACTSAVPTPSHVLTAMGLPVAAADETIRVSFGRPTATEEVDTAARRVVAAAQRIRGLASPDYDPTVEAMTTHATKEAACR